MSTYRYNVYRGERKLLESVEEHQVTSYLGERGYDLAKEYEIRAADNEDEPAVRGDEWLKQVEADKAEKAETPVVMQHGGIAPSADYCPRCGGMIGVWRSDQPKCLCEVEPSPPAATPGDPITRLTEAVMTAIREGGTELRSNAFSYIHPVLEKSMLGAVENTNKLLGAERARTDSAWNNRNHFCEHINIIAKEVLGWNHDSAAPDAVSREVKKKVDELERESAELKSLLARYAAHVAECEGVDFLKGTPGEWCKRVREILKEVEGQDATTVVPDTVSHEQHYFDALHELRARMSRAGFLGGAIVHLPPKIAREYYELVDKGMNPPPEA